MKTLLLSGNAIMKAIIISLLLVCISMSPKAAVIQNEDVGNLADQLSTLNQPNYKPALDALRKNEFQKSIDLARDYVSESPMDANAHMLLILGWIGIDDEASIQTHFREVKARVPKIFPLLSHQIAIYYAKQKRYYMALQRLNDIPSAKLTVDMLRLQGEILEVQGDMQAAINIYESLLEKDKDASDALLALARLNILEGNAQKSLIYSQQLSRTSSLSVVHVLSGTASMMMGNAGAAKASFEKAVALDDKNAIAWNQLGALALLAGDNQAARSAYEKANVTSAINEAYLGSAYTALYRGDADGAIEAIGKISATDSLSSLALAAAHLAKNDNTKANAAYQGSADLFLDFGMPGFTIAKYTAVEPVTMARLLAFSNDLYRQGYFTLNIGLLEKNRDLMDKSAFLGLTYARSLWKSGNKESAQRVYASVQKQYPQLVAPILESADIAFNSGDNEAALKGYEQAVKQAPNSMNLRMRLASLYNQLDRPNDAIREFETGLKSDPQSIYILDQLASTYLQKLNQPKEALPYVEKARALNADNPNVQNTLAAIQYALGQYQESSRLYLQLSELNIANPSFYYDAGMSLLKSNNKDLATNAFERVLDFGPAFEQFPDAEVQYKALILAKE